MQERLIKFNTRLDAKTLTGKVTLKGYQMKENFRPREAAQYLSIGLSTVWLFAKQGKLHPVKLSDRVTIFTREDLDAFIAAGGSK